MAKNQRASTALFMRLKGRYQALLFLPIFLSGVTCPISIYIVGSMLAVHFGIDPKSSINAQPGADKFVLLLMTLMVLTFFLTYIVSVALISASLVLVHGFTWRRARLALTGDDYPASWFREGSRGD